MMYLEKDNNGVIAGRRNTPSSYAIHRVGMIMVICLKLYSGICQSGYNQTFDEGVFLSFRSILYANGNLLVSGIYRSEDHSFQQGFLASFDTLGELSWWREIKDDSSSITINSESGMCISNGELVAVKYGYFEKNSIGLSLVNFTGKVVCMKEYEQTGTLNTIPRDIIPVNDGFMLTGNIQFADFNVDAFVLKINGIGKAQWMRTYGHPLYWESSRTITMIDDNEFVFSGSRYQWDQEPEFYHGWACAIDSLGNKKWEWEANEGEIPHREIMSMQYDSVKQEWVYMSFLEKPVFIPDLGRDVNLSIPVLVRRDTEMQLLSYVEFGPYSYNGYMGSLERSTDGGYITAGRITCVTEQSPYNDCNIESGRVIKISADNSLEWSVIDTAFFHPELGSRSYLSGVTESPSGSIYAVGWANNYDDNEVYRSYGWLLKITADGCVDTLCTTTSLMKQVRKREKPVRVYPNPARDHLVFEVLEDIREGYVEIFDLHGMRLQREKVLSGGHVMQLDCNRFPPGIYFWRLMTSEGKCIDAGKFLMQ